MYQKKRSVLIFGVGLLQKSLIERARKMGLFTVGIDPLENAECRDEVDAFEVVGGQDFEGTMAIAYKYNINAIATTATDKPLVMMARVANLLHLPFFSEEAARWSTDKFQMKQRFISGNIPCAKGRLVHSADELSDFNFPVIVKPRDNSGSRGVKLCRDKKELDDAIEEALPYSHLDTVLVEEFIEGKEYSIESIHSDGKHEVIQFTEKRTTDFPYNVELGHIQPANISEKNKKTIRGIISDIGVALHFENCPSHTELKINDRGIFVIETSPRMGGDYITSVLTPLSTGVFLEDELLRMALGERVDPSPQKKRFVGIRFFSFEKGRIVKHVPDVERVKMCPHVVDCSFTLKQGDIVNQITSSLNRNGHIILCADNHKDLEDALDNYEKVIANECLL